MLLGSEKCSWQARVNIPVITFARHCDVHRLVTGSRSTATGVVCSAGSAIRSGLPCANVHAVHQTAWDHPTYSGLTPLLQAFAFGASCWLLTRHSMIPFAMSASFSKPSVSANACLL